MASADGPAFVFSLSLSLSLLMWPDHVSGEACASPVGRRSVMIQSGSASPEGDWQEDGVELSYRGSES